jgi:pyridoxamine 5'-phosphate oxidase
MNQPRASGALRARLPMIVAFALALAFWEAAVAHDLRLLLGIPPGAGYYSGDFDAFIAGIRARYPQLIAVEQAREAATMLVILGLALLAGRRKSERLAFFLLTFGLWDVLYYVWLRLLSDFPPSLATRDLLFMIPLTEWWVQPVWMPLTASLVMIVSGAALLWLPQFGHTPTGLLKMTQGLDERGVDRDPLAQFEAWFAEAQRTGQPEPEAMTLATAAPDGAPAARMALLKGHGRNGFEFYTNYQSRKGLELEANPRAALVFWWPHLRRQVRVEGPVERLEPQRSDTYFASRLRGSRLGAWASDQSRPVASREALEKAMRKLSAQYQGRAVPRPPHWGGYRLLPLAIEFWQERPDRLHDRLLFSRADASSPWEMERLAP